MLDATVAGGMLEDPKESQVSGKMGYAQAPIEATPNGSHWLWSWAFAIPKAAKQAEAAQKFAVWATSKDYIKLVAEDAGPFKVPPATRKSTYDDPEYQKAPFAAATLQAMQTADPTNPCTKPVPYTGIQFVSIPSFNPSVLSSVRTFRERCPVRCPLTKSSRTARWDLVSSSAQVAAR